MKTDLELLEQVAGYVVGAMNAETAEETKANVQGAFDELRAHGFIPQASETGEAAPLPVRPTLSSRNAYHPATFYTPAENQAYLHGWRNGPPAYARTGWLPVSPGEIENRFRSAIRESMAKAERGELR